MAARDQPAAFEGAARAFGGGVAAGGGKFPFVARPAGNFLSNVAAIAATARGVGDGHENIGVGRIVMAQVAGGGDDFAVYLQHPVGQDFLDLGKLFGFRFGNVAEDRTFRRGNLRQVRLRGRAARAELSVNKTFSAAIFLVVSKSMRVMKGMLVWARTCVARVTASRRRNISSASMRASGTT